MHCPKCEWAQDDGRVECQRCGIIFSKFVPFPTRAAAGIVRPSARPSMAIALTRQWLFPVETSINPVHFAGRILLFVVLVLWSLKFITTPLETNYTGESVLHLINLPFHEAGHLLFMPFGRFMTILGGSLGQILMPLICLGTFVLKTRDSFGGSVALWWIKTK